MTPGHRRLVERIQAHGFTVTLRPFVEDALTPGFLGMIAGRTSHERREVIIRTHGMSARRIAKALRHELHHVAEPDWDCGNRYDPATGALTIRETA